MGEMSGKTFDTAFAVGIVSMLVIGLIGSVIFIQPCRDLQSKQYAHRRQVLKSLAADCSGDPRCLNEVLRQVDILKRFDSEVLKSEGCNK